MIKSCFSLLRLILDISPIVSASFKGETCVCFSAPIVSHSLKGEACVCLFAPMLTTYFQGERVCICELPPVCCSGFEDKIARGGRGRKLQSHEFLNKSSVLRALGFGAGRF